MKTFYVGERRNSITFHAITNPDYKGMGCWVQTLHNGYWLKVTKVLMGKFTVFVN